MNNNPFRFAGSMWSAYNLGCSDARKGRMLDPNRFASQPPRWYEGDLHDAYAMGYEAEKEPLANADTIADTISAKLTIPKPLKP